MPYRSIIDNIKKGNISPVYLLGGKEPYFIDKVTGYIEENLLGPGEKDFNLDIFYGIEVDPDRVVAICREFPMMAERRVVIIKEAQKLEKPEVFDEYILNPSPTTVFVMAMKGTAFDKRKKAFNPAKNPHIVLLDAIPVRDTKLPDWILNFTQSSGYKIGQQEARLLAEYLGSDLSKVVMELEKLFISLNSGEAITADLIEKNIGISKNYNVFELQNALAERNYQKAARIILYFNDNPKTHPIQMTLAVLNSYFSKLMIYFYTADKNDQALAKALGTKPYFVKDYRKAARNYPAKKVMEIIRTIREFDTRSKGFETGSSAQKDLYKELLYRIMF